MNNFNKLLEETRKLTVMFIEDDENFQNETADIFHALFHDTILANDGKNGLAKYKEYHTIYDKYPDIIFTDINMPNLDGVSFIKEIYNINKDQHIIVISAHNESNYLLELVNIGIEQFLLKPINTEKLLNTLNSLMNKITINNLLEEQKKQNLSSEIVFVDNILWNTKKEKLYKNNDEIKLTSREYELIKLASINFDRIITFDMINSYIFPNEEMTPSALKNFILRFRKKTSNDFIESVTGIGYRLKLDQQKVAS
jgi:DNA-binding response OmpR family regulator